MLFQPNLLLIFLQAFFEYAWLLYTSWHNHDNVLQTSDKHKVFSEYYVPPLRIHRVIVLKLCSAWPILDEYIQNPSSVFRLLLVFSLAIENPLTKGRSFPLQCVFFVPSFPPVQRSL